MAVAHALASTHSQGPLASPELLLFDLDGVLMDTLPVMKSAWAEVQSELGVQVPFEAYAEHLGRPFADILVLLGLEGIKGLAGTYIAASTRNSHLARPFPGIKEALHTIAGRGCRLGVVTSKSAQRASPLLERLGVPFCALRTPGPERGKPSPDTLLMALVDAGTDPADACYVGDMAVDQEAARRAGLRYVHAGWGYGAPAEPMPIVLREPHELVRLVCTGAAESRA
ncbi:HAD family hydrolase [Streptomyces sp. NPDC005970]|uniref:HAD family hydrolase n=1 Tax=Streptomyces sp. NPDC005970 TaxID=3156723 RepID=UPI0034078230